MATIRKEPMLDVLSELHLCSEVQFLNHNSCTHALGSLRSVPWVSWITFQVVVGVRSEVTSGLITGQEFEAACHEKRRIGFTGIR